MCTPFPAFPQMRRELSLLLRKYTGTVSCSVLAWQSAGPLTASMVYSRKYLLLRKVAIQEALIYIMIALSWLCVALPWGWRLSEAAGGETASVALASVEEMLLLLFSETT